MIVDKKRASLKIRDDLYNTSLVNYMYEDKLLTFSCYKPKDQKEFEVIVLQLVEGYAFKKETIYTNIFY